MAGRNKVGGLSTEHDSRTSANKGQGKISKANISIKHWATAKNICICFFLMGSEFSGQRKFVLLKFKGKSVSVFTVRYWLLRDVLWNNHWHILTYATPIFCHGFHRITYFSFGTRIVLGSWQKVGMFYPVFRCLRPSICVSEIWRIYFL